MKIGIFLEDYNDLSYDLIIGVEKGALEISKRRELDIAIGDFDSIDKSLIRAKKIIEFSPIKDYTDTYLAVKEALKYSNDITIIGGIKGDRIEHFLANLNILYEFPFIKMIDSNSIIFVANDKIEFEYDNSYYSFFALEESIITLKGFKYPLDNYKFKLYDSLLISNELVSNGKVEVKGKVIVIKSKKNA